MTDCENLIDSNLACCSVFQDVLSILGGVIGVVRIPEKWFPGRLDIWLNSHHIMHLMVVWGKSCA